MTRCGIQFFHGHFVAAFKWNPLVFAALCTVLAFDVYAVATLLARAPRLRIHFLNDRSKRSLRLTITSLLAVNWIYLLLHWRNF
jgi:hypothetical protein